MKIAERMNRLGTETAFEVLARAKALEAQGRDIIHLQIGEPDFDTPSNIVEAGAEALRNGYTHYGPSPGMPELREAIATEVAGTRGIDVGADNVVVTSGRSQSCSTRCLPLWTRATRCCIRTPASPSTSR